MKLYALALVSVLFLAACSDSEGGKGIGPEDFNPQAKPANPAPPAYVQKTLQTLKDSKKFHPEDAAVFSAVIDGNDVNEIDHWEQQEALGKLDPVAQNLVGRIRQNCAVTGARKTKTGENKPNSTVVEQLSLSSEGPNCNYLINKTVHSTLKLGSLNKDDKTQSYSFSATVTRSTRESRELRDQAVQSLTNLQSVAHDMTLNGSMQLVHNGKTEEGHEISTFSGAGQMKIVLAEGDVISGPSTAWAKATSRSSGQGERTGDFDVRAKFEGKSSAGDIHMVILKNKEGVRAYVNGEEVDPASLGDFGQF